MRRAWSLLCGLFVDRRGVAAVEFALLLPLLLLLYAAVFEAGHIWVAMRKFDTTVENAARLAARYPEFEKRVRTALPLVVNEMMAPLNASNLNLTLFSVTITSSTPTLAFSAYNFYGDASAMDWKSLVENGLFAPGEAVIVVGGTYSYAPLFLEDVVPSINFSHMVAVTPFFSRSYNYQANNSDWDYFNVK